MGERLPKRERPAYCRPFLFWGVMIILKSIVSPAHVGICLAVDAICLTMIEAVPICPWSEAITAYSVARKNRDIIVAIEPSWPFQY